MRWDWGRATAALALKGGGDALASVPGAMRRRRDGLSSPGKRSSALEKPEKRRSREGGREKRQTSAFPPLSLHPSLCPSSRLLSSSPLDGFSPDSAKRRLDLATSPGRAALHRSLSESHRHDLRPAPSPQRPCPVCCRLSGRERADLISLRGGSPGRRRLSSASISFPPRGHRSPLLPKLAVGGKPSHL